jgi:hypothetical protein
LRFAFKGDPQRVDIALEGGVLTSENGQIWQVADYPTAQVLPQGYALYANYPNPFNASTTIPLAVPATAAQAAKPPQLVIYNALGQIVRNLAPHGLTPGYTRLVWDGKDEQGHSVGSGIYVVHLQAEGAVQTRKMLLLQ